MQASRASGAWLLHWMIIKGVLYALGIPSAVPFLELVAYAGYTFVPACLAVGIGVPCGAQSTEIDHARECSAWHMVTHLLH